VEEQTRKNWRIKKKQQTTNLDNRFERLMNSKPPALPGVFD
jgi:hypothetical protein